MNILEKNQEATDGSIAAPAVETTAGTAPKLSFDLVRHLNFIDWAFLLSFVSLAPMLWIQGNSLWSKAHFQFFPLAWVAFAYFLSLRLSSLTTTTSRFRIAMGLLGAMICLLIAAEAVFISSPWLSQVAGTGLVVSWLLIRAGSIRWYTALAPTSLLFMTLPFPAGYDEKLIQFLQAQSSRAASTVLDCIGILHLPAGNILELAQKRLFVDEACSGVDSLYALMAICLSIVLWFRQRFFVAIASLSLVPVWASCSNIARLVTIVLGLEWLNVDLSHGMQHTILGLIVFACAFGCDYAFIRFVGSFFGEKSATASPMSTRSEPRRATRIFSVAVASVLAGLFLCVGAVSTRVLTTSTMLQYPSFSEVQIADLQKSQSLPKNLGGWQFESYHTIERTRESSIGHHSNVWQYRGPEGPIIVSTDFPFRGFHLLDICYEGSGWHLTVPSRQLEMNIQQDPSKDQIPFYPHILEMKSDDGRFAIVTYSLFRLDGTPIKSQAKAIRGMERFEQTIIEPISFQIQVFYSSDEPISDSEKQLTLENLTKVVTALGTSFKQLDK